MSSVEKISVVIPTFNHGEFLAQAIDSIIHQTHPNLEIVVVDDASSDNTNDIICDYQNHCNNVIIFRCAAHIGQYKCRNIGIELTTGDYVAVQDADDISAPDRLEQQLKYLQSHPDIGALGSQAYIIDKNGGIVSDQKWRKLYYEPEEIAAYLMINSPFPHTSMMVRRDILKELKGYNQIHPFAQDYDLWWRINVNWSIGGLPIPLVYHRARNHRNRITSMYPRQQGFIAFQTATKALSLFMENTNINMNAYAKVWFASKANEPFEEANLLELMPLWHKVAKNPSYALVWSDYLSQLKAQNLILGDNSSHVIVNKLLEHLSFGFE